MTTTQSTTVQVTSTRRPLRTTLSTIRPSTITPTPAYNQPQQPQVMLVDALKQPQTKAKKQKYSLALTVARRKIEFVDFILFYYLLFFLLHFSFFSTFSMLTPQPQTHVSLLNLFAKKPNGPISQSINRFVDTSQKVVKGVEQIVKSTFEIITGAAGVDMGQLRY